MAVYKVKDDGKAQSGLKEGDVVVTGGGSYTITGFNDDGTYKSELTDPKTTTKNYSGDYANANNTYNPYFTGSSTSVGTYTDEQTAIKGQMNANSKLWHTADAAGKAKLEAENKALAAKLGDGVTFDPDTGYWSGSATQPMENYGGFEYGASPDYYDAYSQNIDKMLNEILNRDKFSYNAEEDPLYQQYREQYNREGARAMEDTLGQVSARTGGLASSYATTAAQQANQYYSQQLADKIPELYQLAYQMYLDDIDMKVQDLGLLRDASDSTYNRYRDTLDNWYKDRDFAYGIYRDDIADDQWQTNFDYNAERDKIADEQWQTNFDYNVSRDEVADSQWQASFDREGEYWEREFAADQAARAASRSSGGGSSSKPQYDGDVLIVAEALGWSEEAAAALKASGSSKWYDALEELGINASSPAGADEEDIPIDTASVLAIYPGAPSGEFLREQERLGYIESYVEDGKLKFRRTAKAANQAGGLSPFTMTPLAR